MFNSPFRAAALASRNRRQQLDRLLRITAPHERIVLAGIGLVLIAFVVWGFFGSIVRSVTLEGVLVEPGARYPVVSTELGHVVELLVAPGDEVAAGTPIARQSVPELDREASALRDRMVVLEADIGRTGGDGGALRPLLDSARTALLAMEARRAARELIVSPVGGKVTSLRTVPGDYLPAGATVAEVRDARDEPPLAVLRVTAGAAARIRPGLKASVEFAAPDGATHAVEGEVAAVTAGPLPGWLTALSPAGPDATHRVDIALGRGSSLSVPDGTPCRVRIVLGRHPPAALLDPGRT